MTSCAFSTSLRYRPSLSRTRSVAVEDFGGSALDHHAHVDGVEETAGAGIVVEQGPQRIGALRVLHVLVRSIPLCHRCLAHGPTPVVQGVFDVMQARPITKNITS